MASSPAKTLTFLTLVCVMAAGTLVSATTLLADTDADAHSPATSVKPIPWLFPAIIAVVIILVWAPHVYAFLCDLAWGLIARLGATINGVNQLVVVRCWSEYLLGILICQVKNSPLGKPPRVWPNNSVVIHCSTVVTPGERGSGWGPPLLQQGMGGSEEAVVHMARGFIKLGYSVTVYNRCGDFRGDHDGVEYRQVTEFNPRDKFDIIVSWRFPLFIQTKIQARQKLYWIHDAPVLIALQGWVKKWRGVRYLKEKCFVEIDRAVVLSHFQRSLLEPVCPPEHFSQVVKSRNGVLPSDFITANEARNPKRIVYPICYSRGLEHLLTVWPEIRTSVPDAELHCYYGWHTVYDAEQRARLEALMNVDGVTDHGRIGHKALMSEMRKAGVFAYPSHTPEAFSMSTLKAQLCGCVPIVTALGALPEVASTGIVIPIADRTRAEINLHFKEELIDLLSNVDRQERMRRQVEASHLDAEQHSWDSVAREWHQDFFSNRRPEFA